MAADRNLLFGLLALQNGLIQQAQLVAAFHAWTCDKSRSLSDHLGERGDLDGDDRAAVEALVARHLKRHGDDIEQSLAALRAGKSAHEGLANFDDPDIQATLGHAASDNGCSELDHQRMLSWFYNEMGSMFFYASKTEEALAAFKAARRLKQKIADDYLDVAEYQRDLAISERNIGTMLRVASRLDEACDSPTCRSATRPLIRSAAALG
jgi:hypothetical protein